MASNGCLALYLHLFQFCKEGIARAPRTHFSIPISERRSYAQLKLSELRAITVVYCTSYDVPASADKGRDHDSHESPVLSLTSIDLEMYQMTAAES